jgi:hypothetical protein
MVRTQIQLTNDQSRKLKELAAKEGVSVAELIRNSVDIMLKANAGMDDDEKRRRALAAAGRFHTGNADLAEAHDRYLEQAFQ